ncbi:MAG: hypothetical protein GF320_06000 [Armatimonadia bacterium]|nr:hypothetical protein [Armatimonadia bacterium]
MTRTSWFGSISLALLALAALLMGCGSGNDLGDTLDGSWRLSATGVAEGATLPVPVFLAYDMVIDDSTIIGEGGGGEA